MSNSYRIRTQVGVDKSIRLMLEQDFESLEILSLKLTQSQIYSRPCSDYGVVVGRVSINDGYGVPNAKVSIFIPLSDEDELNPIISDLYPYKNLSQKNEDGYRYNLLPYTQSYSNHTPTGTFPTREDVLIDTNLIEVFDKYYKYTARTNDSGDFMIFGVPIGEQTIHMDVDLSDIGEFSQSPQDLIRMGIATESQVSGNKFRSSTNLNQLPQIISLNRVIEVEPLWGQPEVCNLGITRTDFDLSKDANVILEPTAIFMGSIISSNEDQFQKRNCKPSLKLGNLCGMVTGPGEILAIRQTIQNDANGYPILETYEFEQGGQVIDENGTWLLDVPMNLDRVTTNEFGQQVLSPDPTKGVPTSAKYRFKVKWNQQPTLSEPIKRAYFLVPNVREYGWTSSNVDPLKGQGTVQQYQDAVKSYSFSLDWNDYVDPQSAINCEDTFYPMYYNKVYTVSQLIDQYKKGILRTRVIAVKNILDESCESENNKFPTNDAVMRFDILYLLFVIIMGVMKFTLYALLILTHVLAFVLFILGPILWLIASIVLVLVWAICTTINVVIWGVNKVPFVSLQYLKCPDYQETQAQINKIIYLYKALKKIKLCNLSYPDCEMCDSTVGDNINVNPSNYNTPGSMKPLTEGDNGKILLQTNLNTTYQNGGNAINTEVINLLSGVPIGPDGQKNTKSLAPQINTIAGTTTEKIFTTSLTFSEKINLFNIKAKYFDGPLSVSSNLNNPGGGYNRIKVQVEPTLNPGIEHYDNVMVMMCTSAASITFTAGTIVTFQDYTLSKDINIKNLYPPDLNQFGTSSITGTPINVGTSKITLSYANFNGVGETNVTYKVVQKSDDANYARFPIDLEYFQVITALTITNYISLCNPKQTYWSQDSLKNRVVLSEMDFNIISSSNLTWKPIKNPFINTPYSFISNPNQQYIVFFVRGVDPNTTRMNIKYDLSYLFGYDFGTGGPVVSGSNFKLNHPIKEGYKSVSHNTTNLPNSTSTDIYSNTPLYYDSFHFQPSNSGTKFSFKTFNSDLPKYYSSLDNSSLPFKIDSTTPDVNQFTIADPTYGLTIPSNPINNGFTIEWDNFQFSSKGIYYTPNLNHYTSMFNGVVYDIKNDTLNNRYIIGGDFTEYNGVKANRIIAVDYNGEVDYSFYIGSGFNATVRTIETDTNGDVFVGGDFTAYQSGITTNRIIKLDSNGNVKGTFVYLSGFNDSVYKIYYNSSDNTIYVGGKFTTYKSTPTIGLVKIQATNGSIFTSFNPGINPGAIVRTIISDGTNFYLGGNFTSFKGFSRGRIAKINTSGTDISPASFSTGFNNDVYTIENCSTGGIYIGGSFTTFTGTGSNRIVKLDTNYTIDTTFNVGSGFNNIVKSIKEDITGNVLVGGNYSSYDGIVYEKIIKLDNLATPVSSFNTNGGITTGNSIEKIILDTNQNLIAGGDFQVYQVYSFQNIIKIYSSNADVDFSFRPDSNRGYYPNEILDGGSLMGQLYNIPAPPANIPPSPTYSLNSYYYAPTYPSNYSLPYNLGSSGRQIVMRSDRLPTSTSVSINFNNSFALQNNQNFTAYTIKDEGLAFIKGGTQTNTNTQLGNSGDFIASENNNFTNKVLDSFECKNMVPLKCYDTSNNSVGVKPNTDSCYYVEFFGDKEYIMDNGCYVTVTFIFLSLIEDFKLLTEWLSRLNISFAACRNTWSHLFTNNWINGTLFAFSFKNDRFFDNKNQPYSNFCTDTIFLDSKTLNFYYRSSPYNSSTGEFIGKQPNPIQGNSTNLLFPTTIMDLGPRSQYIQEIVMSDKYDGYVVNKLLSTTYGDVSEILNLLILSRLINTGFWGQFLNSGGANILAYFSRANSMVDADYAQMISINSELGVSPFESINYPDGPPNPIYYDTNDGLFGIFFSSDTQVRDFITPKRTIINENVKVTDPCAFNYFNVFSQNVPFYQWDLMKSNRIFGTEKNNWATLPVSNPNFFKYNYQDMDRINKNSRYFRTNGSTLTKYFKGYIYSVNSNGDYEFNDQSQDVNNPLPTGSNYITVGAPFHFYFGLKKGKSAWDRFAIKWMDFQKIVN